MTRAIFELRDGDAAGRIGRLSVPRSGVTVETPALLPVVNPNLQTIDPTRLESVFGAEMLITNSYIIHGDDDLREAALDSGLHDLLDFSGAIMTDSGSFQLAEYGEIDVSSREILDFQREIGSDVATPVDVPTPPDADRERAERDLETTQRRLEAAAAIAAGEMLVTAPIQGSTHLDLREAAAAHAYETSLDVFPIGAVVPLLNRYRFADVVDVIAAAKRGLGADAPVHLFGAGHPMMFSLAVALGCDLFDSAAYAIYARDGRYLTERGTEHLDSLEYFPCSCPVCVESTPGELRSRSDADRNRLLSEHNLHVTFREIRTIKQAIRAGELLELVEARARAHPAMLDGYRTLLDHAAQLERSEPASKRRPFFSLSAESARRPEVGRHHDRLRRLSVDGRVLLRGDGAGEGSGDRPLYGDGDADDVVDPNHDGDDEGGCDRDAGRGGLENAGGETYDEIWRVIPPFGPVPPELSHTYPLTAEVPDRADVQSFVAAASGIAALVEANPTAEFVLAPGHWPASARSRIPDVVEVIDVETTDSSDEDPEGGT